MATLQTLQVSGIVGLDHIIKISNPQHDVQTQIGMIKIIHGG
jgi:hypothetical protein